MIGAYHQLFQIEKNFRMAKSDLQAGRSTTASATPSRPTHHRVRRASGQPLDREPHRLGQFANLSGQPAATAPSRSRPTRTPLPPPTLSPTTCARPSMRSTAPADLRTSVAEVGTPLTLIAMPCAILTPLWESFTNTTNLMWPMHLGVNSTLTWVWQSGYFRKPLVSSSMLGVSVCQVNLQGLRAK